MFAFWFFGKRILCAVGYSCTVTSLAATTHTGLSARLDWRLLVPGPWIPEGPAPPCGEPQGRSRFQGRPFGVCFALSNQNKNDEKNLNTYTLYYLHIPLWIVLRLVFSSHLHRLLPLPSRNYHVTKRPSSRERRDANGCWVGAQPEPVDYRAMDRGQGAGDHPHGEACRTYELTGWLLPYPGAPQDN